MTSRKSDRPARITAREDEFAPRVRPIKRFGQHFLTDRNIIGRIVAAAEIVPGDLVLEIGPGQGHLTLALLQAGARVVAVEIDRELAGRLKSEKAHNSGLTVLEGDFLTLSPGAWLEEAGEQRVPFKVVANLPYYITSAILRSLLENDLQPESIVVMVQREVADQITAQPPDMTLLGVSVQFFGDARIMGVVPAGAFIPRPKVDSAIVRIHVIHPSRFADLDSRSFFRIVRAGFGVKRKQIHNALERGLQLNPIRSQAALARANIDPKRRAETLSLEEWHRLAVQFA